MSFRNFGCRSESPNVASKVAAELPGRTPGLPRRLAHLTPGFHPRLPDVAFHFVLRTPHLKAGATGFRPCRTSLPTPVRLGKHRNQNEEQDERSFHAGIYARTPRRFGFFGGGRRERRRVRQCAQGEASHFTLAKCFVIRPF